MSRPKSTRRSRWTSIRIPSRMKTGCSGRTPRSDPLNGCRQLRRVLPVTLLGQRVAQFLNGPDHKLPLHQRPGRLSAAVGGANIDDERPGVRQLRLQLTCEAQQPIEVLIFDRVAVCLRPEQSEWG